MVDLTQFYLFHNVTGRRSTPAKGPSPDLTPAIFPPTPPPAAAPVTGSDSPANPPAPPATPPANSAAPAPPLNFVDFFNDPFASGPQQIQQTTAPPRPFRSTPRVVVPGFTGSTPLLGSAFSPPPPPTLPRPVSSSSPLP